MAGLRPIFNGLALAWWKWARAELTKHNPMHPDLPAVIRRVNELENA